MKTIIRNITIVLAVLVLSCSSMLAQSTLGNVWERDRDFNHSDAGRLIQAYHMNDADYVVTAAILDDYSKLNVTNFDVQGNLLWSKKIGPSNLTYWNPRKMVVDGDGNIFIAGDAYDSQQLLSELFVCKISNSGSIEWFSAITEADQYLSFSGMDADGANVYLSYWYIEYDLQGNFTSHIETSKLDGTSGSSMWTNEIQFDNKYAAMLALVHDASGIYQTGYVTNATNNGYDILTLKHDESGNEVWQNTYSTGQNFAYSQGNDLAINDDGDIVVVGTTDYHHLIALGYSSDGAQQFDFIKSFTQSGYVYNVQVDDNANSPTYLACEVDNLTQNIFLAQFDNNGNNVWNTYVANGTFTSMKASSTGDGVNILSSFYDIHKHNYFPQLYGIDASGSTTLMRQLNKYKGYGGVSDFSTLDGNSFFFAGTVKQNNVYTDQMTSRWDVQPLRLATAKENEATISIYPNPCADITTIHFSSVANDVFVYDMNGMLEASFKNASGDLKITTENWTSGVYFVKILNAEVQQTIKLIKE